MATQVFDNEGMWSVRAVTDSTGAPWFSGKDVATAMGHANSPKAMRAHVFDEDKCDLKELQKTCSHASVPLKYNEGASLYINEAGLCSLVFGSDRSEKTIAFKRWVFDVLLPRLRKEYSEQLRAPLSLYSESDLHYKVVSFIRRFYPHALLFVGAGELQDTSWKRVDAFKKGYRAGTPDLIIVNEHERYRGFAIEFKNPRGTGALSEKQALCLQEYGREGFKTMLADEYDVALVELIEYFRGVPSPKRRRLSK